MLIQGSVNQQVAEFISVVIPAYNAEKTIEDALKSLEAQTYKHFEIILIDDGSNDSTVEIVKRYQAKNILSLQLFRLEKNKGPGYARHYGIQHSKGDIIAFLDADDYWLPNHLSILMDVFHKSGEDIVVSAGYAYAQKDCILEKGAFIHCKKLNQISFFIKQDYPTPAVAFRKHLYNQTRGFNLEAYASEDFELFIELFFVAQHWYKIITPTTVIVSKHAFASGVGLSSKTFAMEKGGIRALWNGLSHARKKWMFVYLYPFFKLKFIRRLIIIGIYKAKGLQGN